MCSLKKIYKVSTTIFFYKYVYNQVHKYVYYKKLVAVYTSHFLQELKQGLQKMTFKNKIDKILINSKIIQMVQCHSRSSLVAISNIFICVHIHLYINIIRRRKVPIGPGRWAYNVSGLRTSWPALVRNEGITQ